MATPPIASPSLAYTAQRPRVRPKPAGTVAGRPSVTSSGSLGPVRRRISRACDQCNQLRTKCDGRHPCAHCIGTFPVGARSCHVPTDAPPSRAELNLSCEYMREKKKRGKASRKDLAERAAARAAAAASHNDATSKPNVGSKQGDLAAKTSQDKNGSASIQHTADVDFQSRQPTVSSDMSDHSHLTDDATLDRDAMDGGQAIDPEGYGGLSTGYESHSINGGLMGSPAYASDHSQGIAGYAMTAFGLAPQSPPTFSMRVEGSPLNDYSAAESASPSWGLPGPSAPGQFQVQQSQQQVHGGGFSTADLRYPVLEPLAVHLTNIIPLDLACDLLDLYFSSPSSASNDPTSPYVLCFVYRKRAFLHPTHPRKCRPALLASMLWVAAQTSGGSMLTTSPTARAQICQGLLELTIGFLKALIHIPMGEALPTEGNAGIGVDHVSNLNAVMPGSLGMGCLSEEADSLGSAGQLDDVVTYMHLATVLSARESRGSSVKWWTVAWSLARELRLGRELSPSGATPWQERNDSNQDGSVDKHDLHRSLAGVVSEEEREERRRVWWLLYAVDRHLALCYNRPLFLLDAECESLLQPMDDGAWQAGCFPCLPDVKPEAGTMSSISHEYGAWCTRARGPQFECRGHSIFGYFLPLMTILGEAVDLHHAKNHPRFGMGFGGAHEWNEQAAGIRRHLKMYEDSLKRFEKQLPPKHAGMGDGGKGVKDGQCQGDGGFNLAAAAAAGTNSPPAHSACTNDANCTTEEEVERRIAVAYGTHVLHVLHILLDGKWDPISLLDDEDSWISTKGFVATMGHAVLAANAAAKILELDASLERMPFFFGIYLLQGSFLLLLLADNVQLEASPNVARACQTMVRAHEACVVTLNLEYQVGALASYFYCGLWTGVADGGHGSATLAG